MYEFKVEGMSCQHCIQTITKAVQTLDAKARVSADLATQTVRVDSTKDAQDLVREIEEAGYSCQLRFA